MSVSGTKTAELTKAYNSSVVWIALRALGFDALTNIGFYSYFRPWTWLDAPAAQIALVRRTMALGGLKRGDTILEVACGRGKASYMMSRAVAPDGTVLGVDILPQNVASASWVYGGPDPTGALGPGGAPTYVEGSAHSLHEHPALAYYKADIIFCIEAAFHFDRAAFLASAAQVLKPGGRLVVVDFAWRESAAAGIRAGRTDKEAVQAARDALVFDDFSTESEYCQMAKEAGLVLTKVHDWTANVMTPNQLMYSSVLALGQSTLGRRAISMWWPEFQLTEQGWRELTKETGHIVTTFKHVCYLALVFEHAT